LNDLEKFAHEYWDKTTGYSYWTFFCFITCTIIFLCELWLNPQPLFGIFNEPKESGKYYSSISIFLFISFLFAGKVSKDVYLLTQMTGIKVHVFPINKYDTINSMKETILKEQLSDRGLIAADIIQASFITHKLNAIFPSHSTDDFSEMMKEFLFHHDSKSRVITLLGALFALISLLILKVSDFEIIQMVILGIVGNPAEYFTIWLTLVIGCFLFVVAFLQYFSLIRTLFFKLQSSKSHKLNYLVNDIIKFKVIEELLITRY